MKKLKTQLFLSSILLVVIIMLFVSTTVAYFSDRKQFTNIITSGNVEIVLSEAAVKRDNIGNLVEDESVPRITSYENGVHNYGRIYPSQIIHKDPTVHNRGTEEAWVAFKIKINDGVGNLLNVLGYNINTNNHIDIHGLFSGGFLSATSVKRGTWNGFERTFYNDDFAMIQIADPANDIFEFYFFVLKPLAVGDTVTVFDTMTIPASWNNADMQELANLRIDVEAFGVQTFNMPDCYTAMTTALPEYFNFN